MFSGRTDKKTPEEREKARKERQARRAQEQKEKAQRQAAAQKAATNPTPSGEKVDNRQHQRFARRDAASKPVAAAGAETPQLVIPAHVTFSAYDYRSLVGNNVEDAKQLGDTLSEYPIQIRVVETVSYTHLTLPTTPYV